ncbi:hypothetical protein SVAN01_10903 [Stagonosporopsis vannaccii]|nr:hypothetical protein SVAN01_10903 [Stagonosporopsis vannaccii]
MTQTNCVTFTNLPRDLRDNIYDLTFGSTPYAFSYASSTVVIAPRPVERKTNIIQGLPQGLLTNRSICSEAIDLLLHTRWVGPYFIYSSSDPSQAVCLPLHTCQDVIATCSPTRQSLLFHDQSTRNIALDFPSSDYFVRSVFAAGKQHPGFSHSNPWDDFLGLVHPFVAHSRLRRSTRIAS